MRTRGRDRGSMATELAVSIPLVVVMLVFIGIANRTVTAVQDVESVAEATARAASLQRDPATAQAAAGEAAVANLGDGRVTCNPLLVDVDTSSFAPGGSVTVTISCTVDNTDLAAGFPVPGNVVLTGRASSPVDQWRVLVQAA